MTDFEKWLQSTPEYKNLLIQHGERLFIMREGEYEILTVRLAHRAWSNSRQLSKDEYVAITQEWHTRGFEAKIRVLTMYGIYVDNELVLVLDKMYDRTRPLGDMWYKIRDAIWSKFGAYDKPNCNDFIDNGEMHHSGKRIYWKKLQTAL